MVILGGDAREAAAINALAVDLRDRVGSAVYLLNPPTERATPEVMRQMLAATLAVERQQQQQEEGAAPHA